MPKIPQSGVSNGTGAGMNTREYANASHGPGLNRNLQYGIRIKSNFLYFQANWIGDVSMFINHLLNTTHTCFLACQGYQNKVNIGQNYVYVYTGIKSIQAICNCRPPPPHITLFSPFNMGIGIQLI